MDWDSIKHFKEREFTPPNYEGKTLMDEGFIYSLDSFRICIGRPITVKRNGGFSVTGHSSNSLHYKGLAVDISISGLDAFDAALGVYNSRFNYSIGAYPHWLTQGIHVDSRYILGKSRIFWFRSLDREYHYFQSFSQMLKALAVEMNNYNKFII